MRAISLVLAVAAASACAAARPLVAPAVNAAAARLDAADALVSAGCLDCLIEAYRTFDDLRQNAADDVRATGSAIRAALLIALRESELGLVDGGYLARARQLIASAPATSGAATLVEIAD